MRDHSLDNLAEGVGGRWRCWSTRDTWQRLAASGTSEVGGGRRVSDSLCVVRWNPGSAHASPPPPLPITPQ